MYLFRGQGGDCLDCAAPCFEALLRVLDYADERVRYSPALSLEQLALFCHLNELAERGGRRGAHLSRVVLAQETNEGAYVGPVVRVPETSGGPGSYALVLVANAGAEEGGVVEFNVVVGELGHPVEKLSTPVRVYLVPGRHHVPDLGTGQARKLDQARVSNRTR